MNTRRGFTIVELLIVIVVIAILAAISVVAYNGIQDRSKNTATLNAASQVMKLLQAYVAQNDAYPYTGGDACVTVDIGCKDAGTADAPINSTFNANITTIGNPPKSTPISASRGYGIRYNYLSSRTYDGQISPVVIQYFLLGSNMQCGLRGVGATSWQTMTVSTTGYFSNVSVDGKPMTQCIVSMPGPST